eukprot:TRINITY_DN7126_c0_g2_i2.p1 TRINITY_DN7126_c0_g2~~TRINITY_DN7126_c0_g2_i2.p1  ORF type:complete len:494 (+),score=124.32 TRINITY_DN7126_c0_g2_i2:157-1638(+)
MCIRDRHSSVQIAAMPRSGHDLVLMWPRRKQLVSLSFRSEMEQVVESAIDGDQVDTSAIYGSLTDTHLMPLSSGVTSLKALDLWGCSKVTDMGISKLAAGQPRLKVLCMSRCNKVTDRGFLSLLERCYDAKAVDLSGCSELSEASITKLLLTCKKVKTLNLSGISKLNPKDFSAIPANSLPTLQCISLCGSAITDKILAKIVSAAPNLVFLDLAGCSRISDAGMNAIANSLPNLTALNIQGVRQLTDDGICRVAQCCKVLRGVAMGNNDNFTDGGIDALVRGTSLVHLDLRNCKRLTSSILESIASAGSEGLQTLNLSTTLIESSLDRADEDEVYTPPILTEQGLQVLFSGCRCLSGINLGGRAIGPKTLPALAQYCPNLEHLSVARCQGVDGSGVQAVLRSCAHLRAVNLEGCEGISDDEAADVCHQAMQANPELDNLLVKFPTDAYVENPQILHMKIEAAMGVPPRFQLSKIMQSDAEALMEQLWNWAKST